MDIMMTMMAMEIIMEVGMTMGTPTTIMRVDMMTTVIMATLIMMSMGMATVTMMDMDTSVRGERATTATRMSTNMAR